MKISSSDRISGVEEYYFSRKLAEIRRRVNTGEKITNLGIGSPDLPPHEHVVKAFQKYLDCSGMQQYQSYFGLPELRQAFADYYAVHYNVSLNPAEEILTLMGSKEGIMHLSMALLNPGDAILIPNPGYGTYAACGKLAGATVIPYELKPEQNWLIDLEALQRMNLHSVKVMWVNYPHMPTGAAANATFFSELIEFGKKNKILICNDNPYSQILTEQPQSILSIDCALETACELNSISKSHNMPGFRVGMLAGSKELLGDVIKFKSNMDSGMLKPLQQAAVQALSLGKEWFESLNQKYRERQKIAIELLQNFECIVHKPDAGMFLWAQIPESFANGEAFSDYLLEEHGLFIPPGFIFGSAGDQFVRMSLCSPIEVLRKCQEEVQSKLHKHV